MLFKGLSIISSSDHSFPVERNDFSNFGRGSPKEHFIEIILKSGHQSRRTCRLKKLLMEGLTDGQISITIAHPEHFVLR